MMKKEEKNPEPKCTNPEHLVFQISPGLYRLIALIVVVYLCVYAAEHGVNIDLKGVLRWVLR